MSTAAACLADTVSVTVNGTPSCTFAALSISDTITNPATIGSATGGAGAGKVTLTPLVVLKSLDSCSIPLFTDVLQGTQLPSVVISIFGSPANQSAATNGQKPLLVITLTNVLVNSISDSDSTQASFTEKVTFEYGGINIQNLTNNTSTTCDATANTCS